MQSVKIKDGFLLREIAETHVVVPVGERVIEFKGLMILNEHGLFVWNMLQNDHTFGEVLASILDEYDIDADTAKADLEEFLARVRKNGALEE